MTHSLCEFSDMLRKISLIYASIISEILLAYLKIRWQINMSMSTHIAINFDYKEKYMKSAILFSGQGAQTQGMGKEIYENSAIAREIFDRAGEDIKRLCFDAPQEELNQTYNTQVSIFTLSIAKFQDFLHNDERDIGAIAGFSLGECTAMVASGVFTFEEGLEFVKKRASLMQRQAEEAPQGMIAVLGLDIANLIELIEQNRENNVLEAVNFNCPGQTVVAGENVALDRLQNALNEQKVKNVRLAVNIAGHTSLMNSVSVELKNILHNMHINPPEIPIISNTTGRPYEFEHLKQTLASQVCNPVQWEKSMRFLIDIGIDEFIEIGVGQILSGFMKRITRVFN